ncbi:MAG: hypothetical protein ABSG63_17175 [Spirochaetia bacterium]|jgi:hypothetical protein
MVIHFHLGKVPILLCIGETPIAPALKELAEKDEVLLLTGMNYPREGELARYVLRKYAGIAR